MCSVFLLINVGLRMLELFCTSSVEVSLVFVDSVKNIIAFTGVCQTDTYSLVRTYRHVG